MTPKERQPKQEDNLNNGRISKKKMPSKIKINKKISRQNEEDIKNADNPKK